MDFKFATGKISPRKVAAAAFTDGEVSSKTKTPDSKSYSRVEPPDVEQLGKSSWNLLHSITASYPRTPSEKQKAEMNQFLTIFSHIYPCSWCATDFEKYIREHAPKVNSREELGRWMCEAHNEVNVKLNKEKFDCNLWAKRWKDGWSD